MNPSIPGYKWLNLGKLRISVCVDHSLELASDHDYLGFNNAFRIDGSFQEDRLRPWEVPGWHARTTKAAVSVLKNLGFSVASSFEQHQICPTSAVLRTETDKGRVYLKASTRREAAVVQCVSSFAPYLVESKKHVAELVSAGIPRQGVESIYKRALAMLQDAKICKLLGGIESFALVDEEGKIESKLYCKAILQLLNRVYEEGKAPIGVVHGDIYDDNIVKVAENQGEYIIYDWGSARIDVPFSDVMRLETEVVCGDEKSVSLLVDLIEIYEYGKRRPVKSILTDKQTTYLGKLLNDRCIFSARPTTRGMATGAADIAPCTSESGLPRCPGTKAILYCHYEHDSLDDNGCGYSYRSLQRLLSLARLQGYAELLALPLHGGMLTAIDTIEDKPVLFSCPASGSTPKKCAAPSSSSHASRIASSTPAATRTWRARHGSCNHKKTNYQRDPHRSLTHPGEILVDFNLQRFAHTLKFTNDAKLVLESNTIWSRVSCAASEYLLIACYMTAINIVAHRLSESGSLRKVNPRVQCENGDKKKRVLTLTKYGNHSGLGIRFKIELPLGHASKQLSKRLFRHVAHAVFWTVQVLLQLHTKND
eukprot:IDg3042t1